MLKRFLGFVVISSSFVACANGILAPERDGGPVHLDAATGNDGSTTIKDSSTPKDSSTTIQDGSSCSFTVCGNLCVDTSQDDNNCGQCNNPCPGGSTCTNSQCACSGGMTLCTGTCVDTTSDMNNCGTCGKVCTGGTTCMNSTCQASTSGTPPQGNCSHDLCTSFLGALNPGCDPKGCVTSVCTSDSFCCDTEWDDICVSEVATYCPPYSCP
jgi:hypothetical protein